MTRYILRRTGHAALLLVGVSLLTFLFTSLAPRDYLDEMKLNPQVSQGTLVALRAKYGVDQPLPVRYVRWATGLLRGDMGFSFAYGAPVASLLRVRARNTLLLTTIAMLFAWGVALPLGIWSAAREGGWPDHLITLATGALLIVPDLVLALGLLLFAVRSGWFPAGGMAAVGAESLSWGAPARESARRWARHEAAAESACLAARPRCDARRDCLRGLGPRQNQSTRVQTRTHPWVRYNFGTTEGEILGERTCKRRSAKAL